MRELHVVAVSEDGRHVLLSATKGAKTASHRVRLDARLLAAARGELPGSAPGVELSPKEIQARLRAGESAEHIATTAGVPVTKVARFAGPVAGEMARMIEAAQEAYVTRGRRGRSSVPLGRAVADAIEPEAWSARREPDGRWRVAVAWHTRGRAREAAWLLEPATRELTPVDPASAALGHVEEGGASRRPVARKTTPKAVAKPTPKPTAKAVAKPTPKPTAKAVAKPTPKAAKAVKTTGKTPARPAAKPAKAGKAASRTATTRTRTAPAPTPAATPQAAVPPAPRRRAPAATAATPRTPARPRLRVVTDTPPSTPTAPTAADERDGVKTRASVPAWADVLLGTTPGADR